MNYAATIGAIFLAMGVLAIVERVIPLRERTRWNRAHLGPNLALTVIAITLNLLLNIGLLLLLAATGGAGVGLLHWIALPLWAQVAVTVLALDLSFYVAHVVAHKVPLLWRYHRIHHMDPAVDVTTTIRQHPAEGLIRYAFLAGFGVAVGANLHGFAIYRTVSLFNSLLEHANIRLPARVSAALAWITTWPSLHKIHHSRVVAHTDSNYANLFSLWDRLFGTFTPSHHGETVPYGLDGCDDPAEQTTVRLLSGARGGRSRPAPAAPLRGAAS
jgi:sterol desaturase/sphingolipid hydroxylase (fatty acid hydroxylase superfamily)